MPVIHIDGCEYEVAPGQNLLEACLSLGLDLPYFCWHPALGSIGACRQCAVVQYQNAEDQRGRLVMSCMTPVTDGALFSLETDKAKTFRQTIVESLMLNHPHDCPVCAEGGECHLQDMTVMVGHRDRHYRGLKNTHRNQYLGPLIHHEMNRCIACYRCTRYYRDYAGGTDLAAMAAHDHVYFGRHEEGVLQSEFAGNLVEVCPTGVFTDKSLVHEYTRKWDLQSAPSLCTACAVGCNTLPGERYGKLKRVHNRFNAEVNGYFLCDRGRFGAGFVNSDETLEYPGLRGDDGRFNAIAHHEATEHMTRLCRGTRIAGIGSPRASVEANFLLRTLVGAEHFCPGFSDAQAPLVQLALTLQQHCGALIPDIATIESADAILVLGEDLTNTAPRVALALRQSVRNKAYALAAELGLADWQDAAVRNLAQDQRCPLYIATTADTRLDDVAAQTLHIPPADIAAFGQAVAAELDGHDPSSAHQPLAGVVAEALRNAQRPLIVSGTSTGSAPVLHSAAQVAAALGKGSQRAMLSLVVEEANSLGQALLCQDGAASLASLCDRAADGEIDTLLVMENELYRRGPATQISQLLANVPHVIAMDSADGATLSAAELALPAASFAETEGTLVSLEGRAQRHFPVYSPRAERRGSWAWLLAALKELQHEAVAGLHLFDDVTAACAQQITALAGITAAAPDHRYRNAGVKIPRQPHRYSGRTAMRADVSVHEPKAPEDHESALAFSMEGLNQSQPGSLLPYVWAPGWNSNQSLHKFQAEVGGALAGGTAGTRLLLPTAGSMLTAAPDEAPIRPGDGQWLLVARYQIFGSEELSATSPGIKELVTPSYIELREGDALALGVSEGDGLLVAGGLAELEVRINNSLAQGCAGFGAGLAGSFELHPGLLVSLERASTWQRRQPQMISTDGGGHV